jgi:NAD(P)-dependent dehydrogenase (short-subunit alcohol dehydrogenase family)
VTSFAELHDLTGKVAVVTGGARGIGRAIAGALADAYAPKVRVNAILPGPFRTDASKAWAPEGPSAPFASAASSFTTGAIIRVDGGITRKV